MNPDMIDFEGTDYFDEGLEDGLSGDDVNRRLREQTHGFAAPSPDWDLAGLEIRCIHPEQVVTNPAPIGKGLFFYTTPRRKPLSRDECRCTNTGPRWERDSQLAECPKCFEIAKGFQFVPGQHIDITPGGWGVYGPGLELANRIRKHKELHSLSGFTNGFCWDRVEY